MFRNREDAGAKLAAKLCGRQFTDPLILAIPRGGVATGAVIAKELGAELDVIHSQRLLAPGPDDTAVGAVTGDGFMFLDPQSPHARCEPNGYLADERRWQLREMGRREAQIRDICRQAPVVGRSVIVTDDGIVTGSTMIAALQAIRPLNPHELIVAIPAMPANRVNDVRRWCDDLLALLLSPNAVTLSRCYEDFTDVSDRQVLKLLRQCRNGRSKINGARHSVSVHKGA